MSTDAMMKEQNLFFNPKKSFHLPIYAKQMVSTFADFSCSKPKCEKYIYTLNVLDFIDGSTCEGRETSKIYMIEDFAIKSIATSTHKIDKSHKSNYYVLILIMIHFVWLVTKSWAYLLSFIFLHHMIFIKINYIWLL